MIKKHFLRVFRNFFFRVGFFDFFQKFSKIFDFFFFFFFFFQRFWDFEFLEIEFFFDAQTKLYMHGHGRDLSVAKEIS